jgi:hypothetical protein
MQPLAATIQPLAMQDGVDILCQEIGRAIALFPRTAETIGVVAAAVEAWPMAGGESRGLIEKEQLGPRLPVNRPRCGSATMSPSGVTRFCRGIFSHRHSGAMRSIEPQCAIAHCGISRFSGRNCAP